MLRFVSGMTGGGKSKMITHEIIEYLRFDERPILYYLALRLDPWVNNQGTSYPGLLWTCQHKFGLDPEEVRRRLIPLEESQLARFWAWRPKIAYTPHGTIDRRGPIEIELLPPCTDGHFRFDGAMYGGAIYVIDEAHEHYKKKDFARVSDEGLSWASQNRRAGDEAWLLSQRADLVGKPFRDQSVECYWMINHGHRVFSVFRQPDKISWKLYLQTPPGSDPPLRSGNLSFQNSYLNGCYDTAAGASVAGGAADIGFRPKGISWRWIPIVFVLFLVGCGFAWRGLQAGLSKVQLLPSAPAPAVVQSQHRPGLVGQVPLTGVELPQPPPMPGPMLGGGAALAKKEQPEERVVGVTGRQGAYVIWLASGERFVAPSYGNLGGSIWVAGKELRWARP